ncbi:hypothetical protein PVAP13_2KG325367 [Panicum virgatum]|uniref:Uncharacterized protein n=1 Tax=Panicum virgatum TaxID=38727 RepID=A0A8T0W9E7_PANVG|nr:hypothetical protein PVAP13_2KG325367 [Panicum virgatum]
MVSLHRIHPCKDCKAFVPLLQSPLCSMVPNMRLTSYKLLLNICVATNCRCLKRIGQMHASSN